MVPETTEGKPVLVPYPLATATSIECILKDLGQEPAGNPIKTS